MYRQDYRDMYDTCEARGMIPERLNGPWEACDIHHICGSGNGAARNNDTANILHVCRASHDWLGANEIAGFVLCCWVKRRKGELDWKVLHNIKDRPLPGWLETVQVSELCGQWGLIETMRRQLLGENEWPN